MCVKCYRDWKTLFFCVSISCNIPKIAEIIIKSFESYTIIARVILLKRKSNHSTLTPETLRWHPLHSEKKLKSSPQSPRPCEICLLTHITSLTLVPIILLTHSTPHWPPSCSLNMPVTLLHQDPCLLFPLMECSSLRRAHNSHPHILQVSAPMSPSQRGPSRPLYWILQPPYSNPPTFPSRPNSLTVDIFFL